ncbi:unnamed protein product [Cylindrotheca closterium]|uniref:VWFD domain-containing protein n=1 Tax=Cylindrotheca closterium TaxID=2856 RepID=A0AAD2JLF1_9STRA|nr:unnamed protein product [Cylindrotheca closterium]
MKLLSSLSLTLLPAVCLAATEYQCPLPDAAKKFSAIVLEDMDSAAHNVYTGVAVGGVFKNTKKPNSNIAVDGESFVGSVQTPIRINWNKGINTGSTLEDAGIDWSYFEYMAKNTFSTTRNGYKIVRMTSGGNFNTYSFNNGGQGEDNGKTIVFFDTNQKVTLTKTNDGRQFGPTVIAPFSEVEVHGNAGFVDGLIVAKKLITSGGNPSQLQLHGDYFKGNNLPCLNPPPSGATSGPTAAPTGTPTPVPTSGPTPVPTSGPTLDPTSSPTAGPTNTPPTVDGGAKGDPHFKTWKNEHYEYHGQCDMILVQDPDFANGLGIEVQIRTKLVRHWSYIKNAAIRIGEDVLEVEGSADPSSKFQYWYNFESRAKVDTFAGFPLTIKHRAGSNYTAGLEIDLSSMFPGEKIVVATWKEFVRVDFKNPTEASFGKSVGLLGDFHTGETLARDGITVHNDFWTYGNEWQVLPNEFMLFHVVEQPQFPKKCIEPEDPQGERRRRLEESSVTEEQAEAACASIPDELDRKDCVYDIIATQDMDIVGAY